MRKRPSKAVLTQVPEDTYAEYNGPSSTFKRGLPDHALACFIHGEYMGAHASSECPRCDWEDTRG